MHEVRRGDVTASRMRCVIPHAQMDETRDEMSRVSRRPRRREPGEQQCQSLISSSNPEMGLNRFVSEQESAKSPGGAGGTEINAQMRKAEHKQYRDERRY